MQEDCSIDIETLGTGYNAAVLSVGAVMFNRTTGKLAQEFYAEVDFAEAVKYGNVNGSTVAWWITQGPKAKELFSQSSNKLPLRDVLMGLADFMRAHGTASVRVWGNGATILEHAYDVAGNGLIPPWKFWNIRDLRTLMDTAGDPGIEFSGTPHNAMDDAKHQARQIAGCFKRLSTTNEDDEL